MSEMSELFSEASAPHNGDQVQRPLNGLLSNRVGTVSSVETESRPKPWIQVEWVDGGAGWYARNELVLVT